MYGRCQNGGQRAAWGHAGMHRGMMGNFRRPKYNVPVNIAETESSYELSVYATGFDKSNIKLRIADESLYISGSRELPDPAPQFTQQEFPVKNFERVVTLNGQVDTSKISARQENGVLYISLPKTELAKQPEQVINVD